MNIPSPDPIPRHRDLLLLFRPSDGLCDEGGQRVVCREPAVPAAYGARSTEAPVVLAVSGSGDGA